MAHYLSQERDHDVVGAYRRYQEYLRVHEHVFPPGAFSLATSEWYQNASDHRCPHDAWLESITISESADAEKKRGTTIRVRLLGAYHDGHIEYVYSDVSAYDLQSTSCTAGSGDWLYDEFRLSDEGRLIHEIEWEANSRWIIEAADVAFSWIEDA